MTCECCMTAREYPELTRKQFDPACIYCGARYHRQLLELMGGDQARAEKGRAHVLKVWGALRHDAAELVTLAMGENTPYAPVNSTRKKRA